MKALLKNGVIKLYEEFNRIFDLFNNDIYRLIYSYTLNEAETNDLLQETFIKFYKNMNKLPKEDIAIKKWLIRVAINNCKDHFKTFWHSKVIKTDYKQINTIFNEEFDFDFKDCLKRLEKKYRIPLYLYYYEGYKIEEIASILKENVSTIKMRLSRARKILKKEMEKEYENI